MFDFEEKKKKTMTKTHWICHCQLRTITEIDHDSFFFHFDYFLFLFNLCRVYRYDDILQMIMMRWLIAIEAKNQAKKYWKKETNQAKRKWPNMSSTMINRSNWVVHKHATGCLCVYVFQKPTKKIRCLFWEFFFLFRLTRTHISYSINNIWPAKKKINEFNQKPKLSNK